MGVNIRAVDGELGQHAIRGAVKDLLSFIRTEEKKQVPVPDLGFVSEAYLEGGGRMTSGYLSSLSLAYEELAEAGASVLTSLSYALNKPIPTIRSHIKRAEIEGYLSKTTQGSRTRTATPKARAHAR